MSYDTTNIFAKILRKEIPCDAVYEDEYVLAFRDIEPAAPVHVLIVPKGDFTSFHDFTTHADAAMIEGYFTAIRQIAEKVGVAETGYRLITNHGADASQTVPHFHMHLLGGKALGGLISSDKLYR
ncbi:MAG: histidine triad nucleotide-binding protein [Rickettsiales bacterium]|nr:histidine triad nucleotide-binding protein [Rickettsiales bacterium]|tara:strand:- start:62 stop:436 length:375 start_codon:yes stop_codon:yes gene_type:complete